MKIPLGAIEAPLGLGASLSPDIRYLVDPSEATLRPWPTVAVTAADAPLYRGYPRAPGAWIRCTPILNDSGSYVFASRPEQDDVRIDSSVRWLPFESTYDFTSGNWFPVQTTKPGYRWSSAPLTRPSIETLSYRLGREIISFPSFRMRNGAFFASEFNNGIDDAVAFTISMAVWLQPVVDPYPLLNNTLKDLTLVVNDRLDYSWVGTQGRVDPVAPMSTHQPGFITMVFRPPVVTVYLSRGPRAISVSESIASTSTSTPMAFQLGRMGTMTGNFNLLEFNLWDRPLEAEEVVSLVGSYTSMYGAADER